MIHILAAQDTKTKATQAEMLQCLTLLSGLASKASDSDEVNIAAYYIALDGVSRFALETATRQIIQGALGNDFMPGPPVLRTQCEKVMRSVREAEWRERELRRACADLEATMRATSRRLTPDQQVRRLAVLEKYYPALAAKEREQPCHP